jgi:carboxylesterase type B
MPVQSTVVAGASRLLVVALLSSRIGATLAAPSLEVQTASGRVSGEWAADGVPRLSGSSVCRAAGGRAALARSAAARVVDRRPRGHALRRALHADVRNAQGRIVDAAMSLAVSEDCLYLNGGPPRSGTDERLPVIVFIHGGSFIIGTGATRDGTALARRGVVLVTINYRLGAFGFYSHPLLSAESARHVSGNYGFADAVAALEWVRKNITAFGGDARNVTVMGQSAGGRLIQSLRTSSCARDLFRRAIIESAPIRILPMRTLEDAELDGSAAAAKVAASSLPELRSLTAQQVLENFPTGQPVIDGHCVAMDAMRAIEAGRSP